MNEHIHTQEEIDTLIKSELGVLLYFSTPTCNVCHALKPKIIEAFDENFPVIKQQFIDASLSPEIPAALGIFSVPTIVVFLDGKEFARESRNVSVGELVKKISRPYEMMTS
jgi:thiol-disulfide isomerase/thioredoxin